MSRPLRVGVLTGGGDAPGLNAVIRAVTKSLILQHNAEVLGFEEGFMGMIERRVRPLSYRDVSGILTQGGTILGANSVILGHVQRGGTPTPYDRTLATVYGSYAASMVADGAHGRMAALQEGHLTSIPLDEVAGKTRTVPLDAPMLAAALAVGTSFGVPDLEHRLVGTEASAKIS